MLNTLQYILVGDICFLSTPRSTPTRKLCSTAVFCFIITQRESHLSISLQGCQQHSEAKQQNIIFYWDVSIILFQALWTVVTFVWAPSQLVVSLIQSCALILALQYQWLQMNPCSDSKLKFVCGVCVSVWKIIKDLTWRDIDFFHIQEVLLGLGFHQSSISNVTFDNRCQNHYHYSIICTNRFSVTSYCVKSSVWCPPSHIWW